MFTLTVSFLIKTAKLQHGNEGVPLSEMKGELEASGLVNAIPKKKLDKLLSLADANKDSYITYTEFMTMVR